MSTLPKLVDYVTEQRSRTLRDRLSPEQVREIGDMHADLAAGGERLGSTVVLRWLKACGVETSEASVRRYLADL